jgi:hypothetical protein
MRIKFPKGDQKKFIDKVIENTSSPSLRGLLQFGLETTYSTLKNYYTESRTLPEEIFIEMLEISKIKKEDLNFEELDENTVAARD